MSRGTLMVGCLVREGHVIFKVGVRGGVHTDLARTLKARFNQLKNLYLLVATT